MVTEGGGDLAGIGHMRENKFLLIAMEMSQQQVGGKQRRPGFLGHRLTCCS